MDRKEALELLGRGYSLPEPGQEVEVDRFRPADAPGVARLFHGVYGEGYPADIPYVPELLVRANEDGTMFSVVGRTASGDVVAHMAYYRSSAPNPRLYELGQGVVLRSYRRGALAARTGAFLLDELGPALPMDAGFGESVAHHTAIQRVCLENGCAEVGLEVDLMPEGAYAAEGEPGRVSVVLGTRTYHDRPQRLHVPPVLRDAVAILLSGTGIDRSLVDATGEPPPGSVSRVDVMSFASAGVLRANVAAVGDDADALAARLEERADAERRPVRQVFLSLHEPWAACLAGALERRGYFLGGIVPRWFDHDALFLQKLTGEPGFDRMKLASEKARRILELLRSERQRVLAA